MNREAMPGMDGDLSQLEVPAEPDREREPLEDRRAALLRRRLARAIRQGFSGFLSLSTTKACIKCIALVREYRPLRGKSWPRQCWEGLSCPQHWPRPSTCLTTDDRAADWPRIHGYLDRTNVVPLRGTETGQHGLEDCSTKAPSFSYGVADSVDQRPPGEILQAAVTARGGSVLYPAPSTSIKRKIGPVPGADRR